MGKAMTRILTIICIVLLLYLGVVITASVVQLADAADRIYLGLGQPVFWGLMTVFALLAVTPVVLYLGLPRPLIPPADTSTPQYDEFLSELRHRLKRNPRLQGVPLNANADIPAALARLAQEADDVVRDTASTVFVGTAVMQNGRLDGLIVLATQFRMIWRIASIYHQRPSPRQMLYLYSNVGVTALLADSIQEITFSELAVPVVASVVPSLKGAIPGLQGVAALLVNSIANGAANSFLTFRVGIVARQYCEALTVPSRQEARRSATVLALALVGQITKEHGARIVQSSWDAVRDTVGGGVDAVVQGVKETTDKVVDATASTAKTWGAAIASTARGVQNAAEKITARKEPNR